MSNTYTRRVVLVTGGSRGIGAAIVRRFAQEGAAVAFTYASSSTAAERFATGVDVEGGNVFPIQADSTDDGALKRAVALTIKAFGPINILVNNLGLGAPEVDGKCDITSLDRVAALVLRPLIVAVQAASPYMAQGSRIVIVNRVVADSIHCPPRAMENMMRASLFAANQGLARDLASLGITVNAVHVGLDAIPSVTGVATQVVNAITLFAARESSLMTGSMVCINAPQWH